MRQETILLSETTLLFAIGGQLFDQATKRKPRKAEKIMQKTRESFRNGKRRKKDNEGESITLHEREEYPIVRQ